MTNKLAEYGHTFQAKSIACLMTDVGFMAQIYDILDESHYDNDALKWIIKECKSYYNEYKKSITKSLSETVSIEFLVGFLNFSFFVVYDLSILNDVPVKAATPKGFS